MSMCNIISTKSWRSWEMQIRFTAQYHYLIEFGTRLEECIYQELKKLGDADQLHWRGITGAVQPVLKWHIYFFIFLVAC